MPGYAYQAGDHIGSYRVVDEVASGETQQVYLVRDSKRDRELVLRLAVDADTPADDSSLAQDASRARQLSHPNLAAIHDMGVHDGHRYVVSEAVDGIRLDRWLEQDRPWRDVVRVFEQVARGLASAHQENLVRHSFSPEQVVMADSRVRIVDLGLASSATPIDAHQNQAAISRAMFRALHLADPDSRTKPPVDSEVPQVVHRAMIKGLADDPSHRFAGLSDLADELHRGRSDPPSSRSGKLAIAGVAVLAMATLGYFALRSDDQKGAEQASSTAAQKANSTEPDTKPNQTAEEAFAAATAAYDAGRFLEAAQMYQRGYGTHRKEAFLWNAGLAYKRAGAYCKFYEVAALYEQVLPEDTPLREKQMAMGVRAEAQTRCQHSLAERQNQ